MNTRSIGTIPLARLDVNGSVKSSSLSGAGTRMVVADASGLLATQVISTFTGDNLGNHTATQNLNMNTRTIFNISQMAFLDNIIQTTAFPFTRFSFPQGYGDVGGNNHWGFGTSPKSDFMVDIDGSGSKALHCNGDVEIGSSSIGSNNFNLTLNGNSFTLGTAIAGSQLG